VGNIREDVGLTVRVEQDGEVLVIRLAGELDLSTTQTLMRSYEGQLTTPSRR
jgi:hypothetical protein